MPAGEDDDDEEQPDLFGKGADLMNVLAGMQELGRQPFEVLASRKRMNRRQRRAAEEVGAARQHALDENGACSWLGCAWGYASN